MAVNFNLSELFTDTDLADLIFVVEKEEITGHRSVFAKTCAHFEKLLNHDFEEFEIKRILVNGTSAKLFNEVKRFIYLGQLNTSEWSIEDILALLSLADEYQFKLLVYKVMKVLEAQPIDLGSWNSVYSAASAYESQALKRKCVSFAEDKIVHFLRLEDFDYISAEFICCMFESPKISMISQDQLVGALFKWKKSHNANEIISVFPKINWSKVSPDITAVIVKELFSMVMTVDECKFWNIALVEKPLECVARYENVVLKKNKDVYFTLSKYQCCFVCCLCSTFMHFWFIKDDLRCDIPIKRIEWESTNHYTIISVYGLPLNGRGKDMVLVESTANSGNFKYRANFSDVTPVFFIEIYSEHFDTISAIRLQNLVIL